MTHEHGTGQSQTAAGTGILEEEHLAIHRVVAAMAGLADELEHASAPPAETLDGLVSFLRVFVDGCHHAKEDRWLFPMLEAKGIPTGGCPIGALQHEHERGRALGAQLAEAVQSYSAREPDAGPRLIRTLRDLLPAAQENGVLSCRAAESRGTRRGVLPMLRRVRVFPADGRTMDRCTRWKSRANSW